METRTIKISCQGTATAPIESFAEFQGDLKLLPPNNLDALKTQIKEQGFSFALQVWPVNGSFFLIDGHQRLAALKSLQEDGYTVPEIPYTIVEADDEQQAREKVLSAAAQYGVVHEQGLQRFLQKMKMDPAKLVANYPFPNINLPKFVELRVAPVNLNQPASAPKDDLDMSGAAPSTEPQVTMSEQPADKFQVRMVQLFLKDNEYDTFMEQVLKIQQHGSYDNLTDAVSYAVRTCHAGIEG